MIDQQVETEALTQASKITEKTEFKDIGKILGNVIGGDFDQALNKSSGQKLEIPYNLSSQYREAIVAGKAFQYLQGVSQNRIPGAEVKAFRYQTAEGQENDVIFLSHELLTDAGEKSGSAAVYLFDPQDWNGTVLVAKEVFFINQKGIIKKLSNMVGGRKIEITCEEDRIQRDCQTSPDMFRIGLLETDADFAMMWHEHGHVLRNTELRNEEQETKARKRIGIYNFPKMKESGVTIEVSEQMAEDLSLLVSSEVGAWDKASITRNGWINDGFDVCAKQAFVKEKAQALSSYQEAYQPLFEKLPDAKRFTG